jgi:iron complex outermembrane receptor protein
VQESVVGEFVEGLRKAGRTGVAVVGVAAALTMSGEGKVHAQTAPSSNQAPAETISPAASPPAQAVPASHSSAAQLPAIQVRAARKRPASRNSKLPVAATASSPAPAVAPASSNVTAQYNPNANALEQVAGVGKTGTKINDLPGSVTEIPKQIISQQGGTQLKDAIRNSSGISQGGPSSYGFFDRFLIRGLDARIYTDGLSDFDQINGLPHSLNGVDHVEILKGPGSALFGSGPPGGTINIVHSLPSADAHAGISTQVGSFGSVTTDLFATGATTIPYLLYRVDGLIQHTDGFRDLKGADYELRPQFTYTWDGHVTNVSLDVRHIEATPDPSGIVYFRWAPGTIAFPLTAVPDTTKYSSPYDHGNQDYARETISDVWSVNGILTINQRLTYAHRDLDILRNGDGGSITGIMLTGRTMRHQHDLDDDALYQLEPVWKFGTGPIGHTLLTGFELHDQWVVTHRETANLPNITNVFSPVVPDQSIAGLTFVPNFKDDMHATYVGMYATDQIDVTEQFKVRAGIRQDFWNTNLTPLVTIPGRTDGAGNPLLAGVTETRNDTPLSWNAGAIYHVMPGVSPYAGVATSHLANFNSEADQNGVHAPENAIQYEAGVKLEAPHDFATLTTAWFDTERSNVQSSLALPNGNTEVVFNNQVTRGYEADLVVLPTDKWKIFVNATWQRAYLTDNPSQPAALWMQPQGVPRRLLNIFTTYDFKIVNIDGFRVGGGLQARDRIYADALNTFAVPGWVVGDVFAGFYRPTWNMQAGIKNITNATYFATANGVGGFVGDPRTYYIKASLRY